MLRLFYFIILTVAGFFLQSCMVSKNRVHSDFLDENPQLKNSNFVSINVPTFLAKSYVKNTLKQDGESQEVIDLIKKVKDVKLLVVENTRTSFKKEFQEFLSKNNYEEWMSVRQQGNLISLNAKSSDDLVKRLIISVMDDKGGQVFVDVTGKFTSDDISKIINATENNQIKINQN